eukprot:Opistho-1_new@63244
MTMASTLRTSTSAMRTLARDSTWAGTAPLAVWVMMRRPSRKRRFMRSASAWLIEMLVAPVSTRNWVVWPLMLPMVVKCPPGPELRTIWRLLLTAGVASPTRPGEAPSTRVCRRPAMSMRMRSSVRDSSCTPRTLWPTCTVRGSPSISSRAALLPRLPLKLTTGVPLLPLPLPPPEGCALASRLVAAQSRGSSRAFTASVPEVVVAQGHVRHFLLQQGDGLLQIVTVLAGDAHAVALDGGLDLHLAVLDRADDLLGQIGLDAVLDLVDLLDLVAAELLDLLGLVQEADDHVLLGQLGIEHGLDLFQLELAVAEGLDLLVLVLQFDAGAGALEVEAGADLLGAVFHAILDLDHPCTLR